MKKLILTSAIASLMATAVIAQTTVTTTTGTGHAAVRIEPQYRTKIKSYVTEHKVRAGNDEREDRRRLASAG
jgi:hypothetical protein